MSPILDAVPRSVKAQLWSDGALDIKTISKAPVKPGKQPDLNVQVAEVALRRAC